MCKCIGTVEHVGHSMVHKVANEECTYRELVKKLRLKLVLDSYAVSLC